MIENSLETPIEQPTTWTLKDTIWGTLAAFGLFIGLMVLLALIAQNNLSLGLIIGFGELVFLLPIWWFAIRKYRLTWAALGLARFEWRELFIAFGLLIVGYTFNITYSLVLAGFGLETPDTLTPLLESGVWGGWMVLGAAVVAPVVEELFFRGFIFTGLKTRFSWPVAALISAAVFALNHLDPISMVPIFVLGLILAYIYQRSKSIWPAILMHTTINSCALVITFLVYSGAIPA